MNWESGYSAQYYYTVVDPATWRDIERHELTGGSITKNTSGLMESASITSDDIPAGENWVRVWLAARQEENGGREPLYTGLMQAPEAEWEGMRKACNAECYSVLKQAEDILLPPGWYVLKGQIGAKAAADLVKGKAPVIFAEGSPMLADTIVAEEGETNLSMAWKIVNAIGWRIRITGYGQIQILPKAEEATADLDARGSDIVELTIRDTFNWYECPNIFRAISGDQMAIARDDDPGSIFSTVSRGREVWKEERNCQLNDGESITAYSQRRLKEEQAPARIASYSRRFLPDLVPGDNVRLNFPAQGVFGRFQINSQQIELGYGARTTEEAEEI